MAISVKFFKCWHPNTVATTRTSDWRLLPCSFTLLHLVRVFRCGACPLSPSFCLSGVLTSLLVVLLRLRQNRNHISGLSKEPHNAQEAAAVLLFVLFITILVIKTISLCRRFMLISEFYVCIYIYKTWLHVIGFVFSLTSMVFLYRPIFFLCSFSMMLWNCSVRERKVGGQTQVSFLLNPILLKPRTFCGQFSKLSQRFDWIWNSPFQAQNWECGCRPKQRVGSCQTTLFSTFLLCSLCRSRNTSIFLTSSFKISDNWMWKFPTFSISAAKSSRISHCTVKWWRRGWGLKTEALALLHSGCQGELTWFKLLKRRSQSAARQRGRQGER